MAHIFLDIETLPTDRPDVIEMLAASIKPPATYKKSDSIAQWMAENQASELDALHRKTALDGAFGRLCCIGVAIDDDEPGAFVGNEHKMLTDFADYLDSLGGNKYTTLFVGHNIAAFDLRFLMQRYMVNRIKVPFLIKYGATAKPWESDKVFDTMVQWAGVGGKVSLDKLCMALGIQSPKGGITGATVYDHWLAGEIDEIALYCKKDVEATRQVFHRMIGL